MHPFNARCSPLWRWAALLGACLVLPAGTRGASNLLLNRETLASIRPVRVLVAEGIQEVRVRSPEGLVVRDQTGRATTLAARPHAFVLGVHQDRLLIDDQKWPQDSVWLEPAAQSPLLLGSGVQGDAALETPYPGRLRVIAGEDLKIVNEVELEQYVAAVVANEIWPDFAGEAFRAQAVVTRTYVLYHMLRRPDAVYDVTATQGSQVYRGLRDDVVGRMAVEAADYTRGVVCVFGEDGQERIFCTYYSAACGGMSQSAMPLGAESDIPPLAGGVRCDFCKIAPGQSYRWGPVRLRAADVFSRLRERDPDIAGLHSITSITPGELSRFGRPVTLLITGSSGKSREMLAERFRLAVAPNLIRSTDCSIRVEDGVVIAENGRGFGHGLGLCQWGAQGQALAGRKAADILRYYFPGSRILRAY